MEFKARVAELSTTYDLHAKESLEIFSKFDGVLREVKDQDNTEKLIQLGTAQVLEIYDSTQGHKLGYDSQSSTWFFEAWTEGLLDKVWLRDGVQWGERTETEEGKSRTERWSVSNHGIQYEEFYSQSQSQWGCKAGSKSDVDWYEKWWSNPEQTYLEKEWRESDKTWGEKEGTIGSKSWRERWQTEGQSSKSESWNEDGLETWGHSEGRFETGGWKTTWSNTSALNKTDKWWTEGDKKWGCRSEASEEQELIVEWEEQDGGHKERRTYKLPDGNVTVEHEGWGPEFYFKDVYTPSSAAEETTRSGHDGASVWNCVHKASESGDFVHNTGSDFNGKWDEKWFHAGEMKWAEKHGADANGSWFETWKEEGLQKSCSKHGKNDENEWWEEWRETDSHRYCRKEQRLPSMTKVQEWEEFFTDTDKRSVGKHYENEEVVHSWDWTGPLSDHD
jgi:hypothetical protein